MEQLTAAQQAAELNKKNLFATYNHIEAEFVEPDHAIFKLEIRPESKIPTVSCTAARSTRWPTTPRATPPTRMVDPT